MMKSCLVLLALCCIALGSPVKEAEEGDLWVLIVAGSNGWFNYRHQADACHAYQIVRKNGVPEDRIILMMYDDIANNRENPTPGKIINKPGGDDVYHGVKIDYKGEAVTPDNFLAVLGGKKDKMSGVGSGRVIESGPNDRVFVNFVDHGAPGILGFPTQMLHGRDLIKTIKSMNDNQQYKEMVMYIEACESGSIFKDQLPENIKVFATTAANEKESSYACYYDKERRTFLGDVYSIKWMEDSDSEDLSAETLEKQYTIVKRETNTSHVQEFGDLTIAKEAVSNFQGAKQCAKNTPEKSSKITDAVASEHVPMAILGHKLSAAQTAAEEEDILDQMRLLRKMHSHVESTVDSIIREASRDQHQTKRLLTTRYTLANFDCYEPVVELFNERCFNIGQNDYAMRHLHKFVNLCEEQVSAQSIMASIARVCPLH